MLRLIAAGRLKIDPLITEKAKAEEAPRLYQDLMSEKGTFLGVLMKWN
jgi:threonine dehydrogenase-like Zn-dependent dehydrogenase